MAISIEEKIEIETWLVLQQLKRDIFLTSKGYYVTYEILTDSNRKNYPLPDDQRKIIYKLEKTESFRIVREHYLSPRGSIADHASLAMTMRGEKPKGFLLDIKDEQFNKLFYEYEKKYSDHNFSDELIDESKVYIQKRGDDFYYKGKLLNVPKEPDYYKVFCALYALIPEGGEVTYKKLGKEIESRIGKTKKYGEEKMRKFISRNLTDASNGFMHYAKIPDTQDNGKPLIYSIRSRGIGFNNKIG